MAAENAEEKVTDRLNPFSFQIFVKKNPSDGEEYPDKKGKKKKERGKAVPTGLVDIFSDDFPDERGRKSEKDSAATADDTDNKHDAANPFSFKKFLHKDSNHDSSCRSAYTESSTQDSISDEDQLPEFHNQHFPPTADVDLIYPLAPNSSTSKHLDVDDIIMSPDLINSDDDNFLPKSRRKKKNTELPDIFSDLGRISDLDSADKIELIAEVKKLRQTNRELRRDLQDAQRAATSESNRVEKMLMEMKKAQEREVEDTRALEDMIHQVEQNLEHTTARSVAADSIVVKLKQEVKTLKGQLVAVTAEKQQLEHGVNSNSLMVQTAHAAADKLSMGATTAEQAIKQLMSGVDTLRLISETLSSIERFSEDCATSKENQQTS